MTPPTTTPSPSPAEGWLLHQIRENIGDDHFDGSKDWCDECKMAERLLDLYQRQLQRERLDELKTAHLTLEGHNAAWKRDVNDYIPARMAELAALDTPQSGGRRQWAD